MFFAPNPGILAAGVSTGKTYADFVAHITALATSGVRDWNTGAGVNVGAYITTAATTDVGAVMEGSSWASRFRATTTTGAARIIQHGLPSQAAFDEQVSAGRVVFFRVSALTSGPTYDGITRNGYTSLSSAATAAARNVTELIRWDGARAWTSNPSIGGAESEYTW